MRTRFALILSSLMGALLVIVIGTLVVLRARDQKAMLEAYADGFAVTTRGQLCEAWRLYYRSGSYKFREIVRNVMTLNADLRRVFILSVSGEVLYDSMESADMTLRPERPIRRLEDPDLAARAALPKTWKMDYFIPGHGRALLVGTPYFEEWGRHPYSVLNVFTYEKMEARVLKTIQTSIPIVLVALAIVAAVSFWLAGRVTRPILELTQGVRQFSTGKGLPRFEFRTGDEIEELADSFGQLAARIKQQLEKLERANEELATLDRMKTDLLANVSHELRTPLAAIRGYVEFFQEGQLGPVTESQRKGLDVCLRNAERLTKTINMLLDFSRMELGRVSIRSAPFQIGRLVDQVVKGISSEAKKRRINLRMDVESSLRAVDGDRERLTQVLENLITNALKFTPEGGAVEVGARSIDGGARVEITVADTGAGIPEQERKRIFDKFYQSDATATRKYGGIGLGLAIVKSILDAHNSTIVVDERPGGGSVFRFSLAAVEVRTESGVFYGLVPTDGAAEILAIDDDADFLSVIRETLAKQGFTVRTATTAAEGLAAAKERPPRLILLDIRLPDRDGFDLLQALKEGPETRNVPILVASVIDERIEGLRMGAVEYLLKPIDRGRLVEAATRALRSGNEQGRTRDQLPKVLVVDDEEEIRTLIERSLRVNGFQVRGAGTGREALERALEEAPDLILLDLMLPDMSGWDVFARLRESPKTAQTPIVILSAHGDPASVREAQRLGVAAFLSKPVDIDRILERMRDLIGEAALPSV